MRETIGLFLLLTVSVYSGAQTGTIDSLKQALQTEKKDTSKVLLLVQLSRANIYSRPDTAMVLAQQGLLLARKVGFAKGEAQSLNQIGNLFTITGNYPKALQLNLEAQKKAEAMEDQALLGRVFLNIGVVYANQGDYRQAVAYAKKGLSISERLHDQTRVLIGLINIGDAYEKSNLIDSALSYTNQAFDVAVQQKNRSLTGVALNNLGNIYSKLGQNAIALQKYRLALPYYIQEESSEGMSEAYLGMATVFQKMGSRDSSLRYAKLSLATAQNAGFIERVMKASQFLTNYYTAIHNVDSAFAYQSATIAAKDSLFSQEKARVIQSLGYEETVRQQQIQEAKEEAQTQLKFNMLLGGLGALLLVAFMLYRNNRQKQSANALLQVQKQKVEQAYTELKATQAQLVQKEKMASLGELTAGIAHEIQNPLNFVNNFSAVNTELVGELQLEAKAGNIEEVLSLAGNIEENEEKISHHGKRADAIVKSMLQHSRGASGEHQPTNLNALVEEYLKLAYHGYRAKDNLFSADLETQYDSSAGRVSVVPQEIGRVLLNLFNNAFYAVHEKKKQLNGTFEPVVSVSTQRNGEQVIITVRDNGTGMPQKMTEKVFQPFFTTKPTGEGTGLGLSLSYDIITKGHGGELKVESKEGEGATFTIKLPQVQSMAL